MGQRESRKKRKRREKSGERRGEREREVETRPAPTQFPLGHVALRHFLLGSFSRGQTHPARAC